MIAESNSTIKSSIYLPISISAAVHVGIAGILLCGSLFSNRVVSTDGDNSIKAMMIDLSVMAAPEQSLVENTPQIEGVEIPPIIEEKITEIVPDEIVPELEIQPDLIVKEEIIEQIEPAKNPEIIIKDKPIKQKKNKNTPPVQKASKQQVKQEINTDKLADTSVAPSISANTQFSATPTPISRNQPEYPRRALDMRIEGYVIVLYDINKNGRVENIRIKESKPNNIFNRSVINAMKQWKYQAIEAKDLTIKIIFNRNKSVKLES